MSNVRDPPNLINHNLGDDQKSGISTDMPISSNREYFPVRFPLNQKSLPGIRCNRCILQIGIFCRSFLSLNRFSFQMSEFANLVKSWIFSRRIPINQKSGNIFGWVQMQNFFLMSNVRDPPNLINYNLGDDQKTGISTDVRPAFSQEFLKK